MIMINGFIRSQRIQWLEHVIGLSEDATIRLVLWWKPEGKRPRGYPQKYLEDLGTRNWRELVQERGK